jgi:hypothetical protein
MSNNDIINQITLNYLISKQQLEKLNKSKENPANKHRQKKDIYKQRLLDLFTQLLDGQHPESLLMEVTKSFDYFIDNCIYYFEIHDNNVQLEEQRSNKIVKQDGNEHQNDDIEQDQDCHECEDEDQDEDENQDCDEDEDEDENQDCDEDEEQEQDTIVKSVITPNNMHVSSQENFVYPKKRNTSKTEGVECLNQLPLDWFTRVKKHTNTKL